MCSSYRLVNVGGFKRMYVWVFGWELFYINFIGIYINIYIILKKNVVVCLECCCWGFNWVMVFWWFCDEKDWVKIFLILIIILDICKF